MQKLKTLANLWLPVIFWCGLLFYLSSVPNLKAVPQPQWDEIIRSALHLVFYTILYILFFRALNYGKTRKDYWFSLIISFFYGFFDEVHQLFVPTRTFQLQDLLVDFTGAALGFLAIRFFLPKTSPKIKNWARKLSLS